jgi:nucleotide-binding universal stress UspA family protein
MVCVDGSPFGDRAFEYTLNHIDQTKDQIVVVYAVEYIKSQFPHPSEFYQQLQNQLNDESQKHAHQILEAYENKLKAANVKHKVEQLSGDSAKLLIVKYVEENDVDNLGSCSLCIPNAPAVLGCVLTPRVPL